MDLTNRFYLYPQGKIFHIMVLFETVKNRATG